MRIAVACDHAGFPLKSMVIDIIAAQGHQILDLGTNDVTSVDYPDYAKKIGDAVLGGQAERGILLCGSGVGACIAANKIKGIYAGVCHDTYSAHQAVEHDDMNVLCIGARIIGPELLREIVSAFLAAQFIREDRHIRRVQKVRQMEQDMSIIVEDAIQKLHARGQSIWYDNIERRLLKNGELQAMIARGDIRGVTSNPSIFHNAIVQSQDYDAALGRLAQAGESAEAIYEHLVVEDIRAAADLFLPLYLQTKRKDGYVSLEVNPLLAHDTAGTLADARRMWQLVERPNLMIKIPATVEGLPAIRQAIAEGININVTLIFSLERYGKVMEAYLNGLEDRRATGQPVDHIASVASFFISRIDTKIDKQLDGLIQAGGAAVEPASALRGKAAIANAKLAYQQFRVVFSGERFARLKEHGANLQRPLWASTSTKNEKYSPTVYVDELIGPDTVNTIPPKTLEIFRKQGRVSRSLEKNLEAAQQVLTSLAELGISMDQVTQELEQEGVRAFVDAYVSLLQTIDSRRAAVRDG